MLNHREWFVSEWGPTELDPVHKEPAIFENGDFFLRIRRPSTRNQRFQEPKIRSSGWRLRKRRFSNTMTSWLGSRLALPYIRFENATCGYSLRIYGEKISVFENTRLLVDGALEYWLSSTRVLDGSQSQSEASDLCSNKEEIRLLQCRTG